MRSAILSAFKNGRPARRDLLTAIMVGAGAAGLPQIAAAQGSLRYPEGPCRLARTLTRSLFDGNAIRVTRQWRIRFTPSSVGLTIVGEQISAEVDAPDALAEIAEIEERRSTASMWPIRLTPSGLIIAAGRGIEESDLDESLRRAQAMIAERHGQQSARAMVRRLAAELQQAGASMLDRLPDDLFFPSFGPLNLNRQIELPDGQVGEFSVAYEAFAVPGKGWLASAQRQVITQIAGTQQTARDNWSLTEL